MRLHSAGSNRGLHSRCAFVFFKKSHPQWKMMSIWSFWTKVWAWQFRLHYQYHYSGGHVYEYSTGYKEGKS